MRQASSADRRTVLKLTGASVAGGAALIGSVAGHDANGNRKNESFTWGNNEVWEMLESEPGFDHGKSDGESDVTGTHDSEGNEESHRPLWVIDALDGTGLPGSEHSPHPAPVPGIDHVVPLGGGGEFTAQWHVHLVVDPAQPFMCVENCDAENDEDKTFAPNFVNRGDGDYLTSAARVRDAEAAGDIAVIETEVVFTCPVRPHGH